jgi:hypothetical protein
MIAATLLIAAALPPGAATADPYQVEVLVFARPADPAVPTETNDHRPGCLARARPPAQSPGTPGAPSAVGTDDLRLVTEARALQRPSAGMQVLAHSAWRQEVAATTSGPWVRIGDRTGTGLAGCLRAKLTPVPEIEIDLVYEAPHGERHSLFGTARIRPGDVHYFDHPALGTLVRLDSLAAPAEAVPTGPEAAAAPVPAAPAAGAAAGPRPAPATDAAPAALQPPPPPPKKPFRW